MNLITPDGGLLFWMVVIFAVVLFILAKWGFPIITSSVEARSKRIADSLRKADEVERKEAIMAEERQQMIDQAKKEQARILREASAAREEILSKARQEAADETAKMIAHARTRIRAKTFPVYLSIYRRLHRLQVTD